MLVKTNYNARSEYQQIFSSTVLFTSVLHHTVRLHLLSSARNNYQKRRSPCCQLKLFFFSLQDYVNTDCIADLLNMGTFYAYVMFQFSLSSCLHVFILHLNYRNSRCHTAKSHLLQQFDNRISSSRPSVCSSALL